MNTIWDEDQIAYSLGMGLLSREVASWLLVLNGSAEGSDSAPWLEVKGSAGSYDVIGCCSVPEA